MRHDSSGRYLRPAYLDDDYRFVWRDFPGQLHKTSPVPEAFDISGDDLGIVISRQVFKVVFHSQVGFIAGADIFTAGDTGFLQISDYLGAGTPALGQDSHGSHRHFTRQAESGQLRLCIGVSQTVRADETHSPLTGDFSQFALYFLALFTHFSESGGNNNRPIYPLRYALT